jgi:Flp pilus assembly protein CpaB
MAEFSGKGDTPFSAAAHAVQKRTGPNISSSWIIMVLSGLIAMIVFLFATNQATNKVQVLVAANDIETGQQVKVTDFKTVSVTLDSPQLNRLILAADSKDYVGSTAAGPIGSGDFIAKSQLREAATTTGLNAMSIPVDPTHAAGGNLARGDRVDILDETTGSYAARGIEVIDVKNGNAGGALASSESFHITVAVTADQAVSIGTALKNQKLDVIRSTGGTTSPSKS